MEIELTDGLIERLTVQKNEFGSKRGNGFLLNVSGSVCFRGAAYLSTYAALRSGAGIVCLASIEKVISAVSASLHECIFLPLEESEYGTISSYESEIIIRNPMRANALLIGCGLSCDDNIRQLVCDIAENIIIPSVFDADALNALSGNAGIFKKMKIKPVITPHYAEMARLCSVEYEKIEKEPLRYATEFAKEYGPTVVLKSYRTLICTPDGKCFFNDKPNAGLAKGGSGDVLAGIIASLLAQGYSSEDAAKIGVFVHSKAAEKCRKTKSAYTMLPHDLIEFIEI